MSRTFPNGGHGRIDTDGIWQAVEQFKARFEKSAGSRVGRGDVRAAVLALLAEKPMHGYQIINEIEQRSGGEWKPSAGSVYPTLQLLSDEGLISAEESNGRKTYSLTESGRAVAGDGPAAPWSNTEEKGAGFADLPKAGVELAQAAAQVQRTGSPEQIRDAIGVLEDARKRLYAILARD